jgi:hypothetical protein
MLLHYFLGTAVMFLSMENEHEEVEEHENNVKSKREPCQMTVINTRPAINLKKYEENFHR